MSGTEYNNSFPAVKQLLLDDQQQRFYIPGMNLGGRLKLARENRQMTQEKLAELASTEALPLSQALISALEKRDSETSTGLFAFARVLKVSAEWLQTGQGKSGLDAPAELSRIAPFSTLPRNKAKTQDVKSKRRTAR